MLRRMVFVVGFVPVTIFAGMYWIATGKSGESFVDRFGEWGCR